MWLKVIIIVVAVNVVYSLIDVVVAMDSNVQSLPFCSNKSQSGVILVSTLDGKLSALNASGQLKWDIETGPGPLLISTVHKLELTNNGEWIRIIPSLTGTLYKFDGSTIDPISISAETLLKSSFKYSDDLVIAGGLDVRTYGVGLRSGKFLYECNQSKCSNHGEEEMGDVLVIERTTKTIRAVEPRSGFERWNFTVGLHNIKLTQISCIQRHPFNPNITAVIPEGLLTVLLKNNDIINTWQYKFNSPIVKVWTTNGLELNEVNLFSVKNTPNIVDPLSPSIYIGMHQKQLYIHESPNMLNVLQSHVSTALTSAEDTSITKIPWKPIPASSEISSEDDSTALSVLNNSEYVNGNGYYLYTEQELKEKDNSLCDKNTSQVDDSATENNKAYNNIRAYLTAYLDYYFSKEFFLFVITLMALLYYKSSITPPENTEIIVKKTEKQLMPISQSKPSSRFAEDFDTVSCLGKGGFGIVFEVKHRCDCTSYAIKRITLPKEEKSKDRVMREVIALAKLEHKHIVRYFTSWIEEPPLGWEELHDRQWLESFQSENITSAETTVTTQSHAQRVKSISISIPINLANDPSFDTDESSLEDSDDDSIVFEASNGNQPSTSAPEIQDNDDDDSFVVSFENSTAQDSNAEKVSINSVAGSVSKHMEKKINWKRPGRKHYSWDMSQNETNKVVPQRKAPTYLYIQMQLCQKDSLKEWLLANTEREYSKMLDIFSQILEAVEYIHSSKLIHRDLKPSNIFFSLTGEIKVGDFGLVKDIEDSIDEFPRRNLALSSRGYTREVGTQLYMSPEQLNGEPYDYKVDIYSLGIILFELLVPFSTAMERVIVLTNLKEQKYPEGFQQKYPAEYSLLESMLDKDPNKRLTTIEIKSRKPFNNNLSNSLQ
ncbi:pancreatic eIF-2alpha kinase isoform X1 [Rhynchophorus ferrugineus]|uniref:pancreatic eIF-2alpha kinase isoform X1 n=1 Tax=Rhynchophorus ferrugineus TaxID=354439 RepID=UPI003FCD1FFC